MIDHDQHRKTKIHPNEKRGIGQQVFLN